jgi:hypothetical protein
MRAPLAFALVLSLAAPSLGCKNLLKKKLAGMDAGTGTTTASLSQDTADDQLQDKLEEYIKCLNSLSSPIHQSRHRYLSFIPRTGPTGREVAADLLPLPPGATTTCSLGVGRAKALQPSDPKLESAGSEFAGAAQEIDKLMREMDVYYENRLFVGDKWAKGKAMHPRLLTSWNRFSTADSNLHNTLDGITKPLAQRLLARIEREDGQKFRYGRKKTLITARELVEASDPIGEDDDIDFALYGAAYTDFEKALDGLVAYGTAHRSDLGNAKNQNFPMAESNFDAFVKEVNDFKKSAKDFQTCLNAAPAKAKTSGGKIDTDKMGNCSNGVAAWKVADEVLKQYNEFIRTSNAHQFP